MKIILAHCFYRSSAPSGEDSVYLAEKAMLERAGITVVPFEKHNDDIVEGSFIHKASLAKNCIWSGGSAKEIGQLVRSHNADIVHFHNTFPQMSQSVYRAAFLAGAAVVQTLHNYRKVCPGALLQREGRPCEDCIEGSLVNAVKHRCYRGSLIPTLTLTANILMSRTLRAPDYVNRYIALTEFARSRVVAGGLPESRVVVKPNFVEDCGTGLRGDYVVYVGRLSGEKGVRTLLEAWKDNPSIPLKVLGDGPIRAELEMQAISYGLNVEFLGYLPRVKVLELIKGARFQVVPSEWYEGFPMVVLEAYSLGKPLIASRIGSLEEIVDHGETGFHFEAGDPRSMAGRVSELWSNRELCGQMGAAARAKYENNFTCKANEEQLKKIYHDAIVDRKERQLNNV